MLELYIVSIGIIFTSIGIFELLMPGKAFLAWKKWSRNRFFFLHGLMLITIGFPMTFYKGAFSAAVFVIGLIIVLTGPFVLLYPEKIREMFHVMSTEMPEQSVHRIVLFEGIIRIIVGALFISTKFIHL
ncbi:MAG TPA: hypothetical protein PK544_09540 [Spirochaetota bacterium]|nr:hypothetical protein [Spirochaetota bacterium]HPJ39059.1 hypothetical protein [Spirochaetota bacterium]HPQ54490.1 hypothetical protein [Spirochaetota bacterium]